jgi:hypothetical protein
MHDDQTRGPRRFEIESVRSPSGALTLRFSGELDLHGASELWAELRRYVRRRSRRPL